MDIFFKWVRLLINAGLNKNVRKKNSVNTFPSVDPEVDQQA